MSRTSTHEFWNVAKNSGVFVFLNIVMNQSFEDVFNLVGVDTSCKVGPNTYSKIRQRSSEEKEIMINVHMEGRE